MAKRLENQICNDESRKPKKFSLWNCMKWKSDEYITKVKIRRYFIYNTWKKQNCTNFQIKQKIKLFFEWKLWTIPFSFFFLGLFSVKLFYFKIVQIVYNELHMFDHEKKIMDVSKSNNISFNIHANKKFVANKIHFEFDCDIKLKFRS